MKFYTLVPSWGKGTVYYVFESKKFQMGFYVIPWKLFPKFFFHRLER